VSSCGADDDDFYRYGFSDLVDENSELEQKLSDSTCVYFVLRDEPGPFGLGWMQSPHVC
jgi:hypothetical protein